MDIKIPNVTPLGVPIVTIGVWMSGGVDSTLMCYLLAKKIKEQNLPIKIQPVSVDNKRPFAYIAGTVRQKIIELLDCSDIFLEHLFYTPPGETLIWTQKEFKQEFLDRNYDNFKNDRMQALYTGTTLNPPQDIQTKFNYGILPDIEAVRGEGVPKIIEKYSVHEVEGMTKEFIEIRPFLEINKQGIAQLYIDNNIMDSLFPLTRSCEDITPGVVHGPCGICWWCEERKWGFGTL